MLLDSLTATAPPPGFENAHAELIGGLRDLLVAYDSVLAAVAAGNVSETQYRTGLAFQIKANSVYHGVADTDCWPGRATPGPEGSGLTWRCPK